MEASATWGPPRTSLSAFWRAPSSTSGRFCRCAPRDTATRPMRAPRPLPAIRPSSAWSSSPTGAGSTASASPGWPAAAAPSISTRWRSGSCRCSTRPPAIFSIAGRTMRRRSPSSGQILRNFAATQAAWLDDYALYAVLRRQFNTGAWTEWPEPLRRREPQALAQAAAEHARAVADRAGAAVCLFPAVEPAPRGCRDAARSASWATWPSSSTWIRPTCGFIPRSSSWTRN